MFILRIVALFFLGFITWTFSAQGEEVPGSFTMELPFDRIATITPNLEKLKEWRISPEEFKQEAMAALKDDVHNNPRSDLVSVVFRKQNTLGTRGTPAREYLLCIEQKVGAFATVVIKKVE